MPVIARACMIKAEAAVADMTLTEAVENYLTRKWRGNDGKALSDWTKSDYRGIVASELATLSSKPISQLIAEVIRKAVPDEMDRAPCLVRQGHKSQALALIGNAAETVFRLKA